LVIGGTGFVGVPLVRCLEEAGHELLVFHRGRTEREHGHAGGVEHVHGDRKALASFAGRFGRFAPDVVLDVVPYSEGDARVVGETFRGMAGRVVALSSGDVYRAYGVLVGKEAGRPEPVPLGEDSPLREELFPYRGVVEGMGDYEKILVERVVVGDPDLPGTVLRLPMVYGPGDAQRRLFGYLRRMDDGRPAILVEEGFAVWRWTRGYVENVAAAIALAVVDGRTAGRVYNVGEAEALTEAEWVREVGRAAGWEGEVIAAPWDLFPAGTWPNFDTDQHLVYDTRRLREELGYEEPVSREEALVRTVAWERANPPEEVATGTFDYATEDAALVELGRRFGGK
jgi:nucleoside-diphosphate-sugar epimerase